MTPRNLTQNLLYWSAALAVAVLLSFLSGIATHWPESGPIDWRGVLLGVVQTLLTSIPIVAAGFGLRLRNHPDKFGINRLRRVFGTCQRFVGHPGEFAVRDSRRFGFRFADRFRC